jgi:hypothetical protein
MLPIRKKLSEEPVVPVISLTKAESSLEVVAKISPEDEQQTAVTKPAEEHQSATAKVLETYELLEMILCQSAPRDVLCYAQRVSCLWRDVIKNCQQIRKLLWFKPWAKDELPKNRNIVNPFILSFFLRDQDECNNDEDCLFCEGEEDFNEDEAHPNWDPEMFYEIDWSKIKEDPRYGQKNASWRRMLLVQPWIQLFFEYYRDEGECLGPLGFRRTRAGTRGRVVVRQLGPIYTEVALLHENPCTLRTRTVIRPSIRHGHVIAINTKIKPIDTYPDVEESSRNRYY